MKVIFVSIVVLVALYAIALILINGSAAAKHPPTTKVDYCLAPPSLKYFLPCSEVDRYENA